MEQTPDDIAKKVKEARERQAENASKLKSLPGMGGNDAAQSSAMAKALRAGTEIVAAVIFGAFLGYWADKLLGTTPLIIIIMVFIGFIAGFLNIYRTFGGTKKKEEEETDGRTS